MTGRLSRRTLVQNLAVGSATLGISLRGMPTRNVAARQATPEAENALRAEDFALANIDWQQAAGSKVNVAILQQAPWSDNLKAALPFFQELTGIEATIQDLPEQELNDRTFADLVSRAGAFDAFHMDYMFAPQYAQAQLIEPLDQFLEDTNLTDPVWYEPEDFFKSAWDAGVYQGQTWSLPQTADSTLFSYRKDIFEAAPNSFDELLTAAEAATTDTMAGFTTRGQRGQGMNIYTFTSFYRGFGADFFANFPDDMTPAVNSPEAIEAVTYYADILTRFGPPGSANYTWAEDQLACQQDRAASIIEWGGHPSQIDNPALSQTSGKWAFAQVPEGPGGRWPAPFSWTLAMNASSQNKPGAWLLMSFLSSKPEGVYTAQDHPVVPRASTADSPAYRESLNALMADPDAWLAVYHEALQTANADYRPRFPHWREYGDRLGIAVQSAIAGEQSAQDALNAAQTDLEGLMRDNGYIS